MVDWFYLDVELKDVNVFLLKCDNMISKPTIEKIKKSGDFRKISKIGEKTVRKGLILQAYNQPKNIHNVDNNIRFGITATKKIGKAVIRNKARRRLNSLAHTILINSAKTGKDYVLIAQNTTADIKYSYLEQDLKQALSILGCRRNDQL